MPIMLIRMQRAVAFIAVLLTTILGGSVGGSRLSSSCCPETLFDSHCDKAVIRPFSAEAQQTAHSLRPQTERTPAPTPSAYGFSNTPFLFVETGYMPIQARAPTALNTLS